MHKQSEVDRFPLFFLIPLSSCIIEQFAHTHEVDTFPTSFNECGNLRVSNMAPARKCCIGNWR